MKVLITGGAGYLGSIVARLLLSKGHYVRVLDSLMHGGNALLGLYTYDTFEFIHGDIRSTDVIELSLVDVDAVVHLAAIVGDPACARQPDLTREVNLDASLRLFERAKRRHISRFVFASTCSNYGKMSDQSHYVTEESELRPVSLYAEAKVAVERALLETLSSHRPAVTVLRFATLFGLSPRMRLDLTVNEFAVELMTKRELVVYGSQFWRPYIHVRDAARAIATVLETSSDAVDVPAVFNVGDTSQNYQKGQIVELVCAQVGGEVDVKHVDKNEDPRDYRVSFDKINQEMGFHITRTVEDGIREVIDAISKCVITDFDSPHYRN